METEYRHIRADKLTETAERLAVQLAERFPSASLGQVACVITDATREAAARAEKINQPNWWLRIGLLALALLTLAGVVVVAATLPGQGSLGSRLADFLVKIQGAAVFLSALVVFFWTLEARFKRGKGVPAIHKLRALAHIIDMHQLTKDPTRKAEEGLPTMTLEEMRRYLHFCTELLAVVTKLGQLYVQDFPDGPSLAAVDQLENLGTALSQKIWQKIMILERLRAEAE